jgi:hypothetical protein
MTGVGVLTDAAVMIADGGRVLSDLATLRDQGELFGPVASDPTLWRTLDGIGGLQRDRIAAARARTRRHVWDLIAARHGRIPASKVTDRDLGKTVVIRLDATLVIAHSEPASPWPPSCAPAAPAATPSPTTSRCSPPRSPRSPPSTDGTC